uniref:Secreted protein n=1 Tax=Ixodes scapularis TaxID=6945 RepID=A0A4D5RES3_IXOSC
MRLDSAPPLFYGLVFCILAFVLEKEPTGGHVPYSPRRSQPSSIGRSLPSVSRDTTTGVEISTNTFIVLRNAECSGRCRYFGFRKRHMLCLAHAAPINRGERWHTPQWLPRSRRLRPVHPTAPA